MNKLVKSFNIFKILLFSLLIAALFFSLSCGVKGDPTVPDELYYFSTEKERMRAADKLKREKELEEKRKLEGVAAGAEVEAGAEAGVEAGVEAKSEAAE